MKVFVTTLLFTFLSTTLAVRDGVRSSSRDLNAKKNTKKNTRFPEFKLTPQNEISPFVGVDRASGTATVTLESKDKVCIRTHVLGFIPGLLHIHKGKISENGPVVADFSDMLSDSMPDFYGCKKVTKAIFNDIKMNPDDYYVNAHAAGMPTALFNLAIRGQIIQRFSTTVVGEEEVAPFEGPEGASGFATVSFEDGGRLACIDATIEGFDPVLAHLHVAQPGVNGAVVINFSGQKVAPGRFLGCGSVEEEIIGGIQTVIDILDDPLDYYFNFHLGGGGTDDFNTAIRGQLNKCY